MSDIIAMKPKLADTPPKTAQAGTRMLRRADVMSGLRKVMHYARRNLEVANEEERWADADIQRARLRAFDLVIDIVNCSPQFENPSAVEEMKRAQAAVPLAEIAQAIL